MARIQIATESFSGTLGNWTQLDPLLGGSSNITGGKLSSAAAGSGNNFPAVVWAGAGTFTADQYAGGIISGLAFLASNFFAGVGTRSDGGTDTARNFYAAYVEYGTSGPTYTTRIIKVVAGVVASLANTSLAWADGDAISLESVGTAHTVFKNGVATALTATDATFATGKPLAIAVNATFLDDWEGGNLGAAETLMGAQCL